MAAVPASGLMISGYRFVPSGQNPTTSQPYTQSEYLASLRSAPFPGTGGVTKLTDEQALPNYKFYNYPAGGSQQTGYNLTNIVEDAEKGMVSFDFWKGEPTAVNAIRSQVEKESGNYYLLDGRSVGTDLRQLPKGLYIRNGKKVLR